MNSAIRRYKKAEAELKAAEQALNAAVNPHIAKVQDDEHRIMRIIHLMPGTYTGTRRMYERILRLREPSSENAELRDRPESATPPQNQPS